MTYYKPDVERPGVNFFSPRPKMTGVGLPSRVSMLAEIAMAWAFLAVLVYLLLYIRAQVIIRMMTGR
jgi:hypothetical protein